MPRRDLPTSLVYLRNTRILGVFAYYALKMIGVEIPRSVEIGEDFTLVHGGVGVVVHPNTVIGDRVKIYPGVVLGRTDIQHSATDSTFERIVIEDDVILSPGSKVLGKVGELRVAQFTMLGANAVLLESTNPHDIWVGVPAKRVGERT